MTPTIPPSFIRLADNAYPIPAWHDPDPATHVEVFMDDPPEVPPGCVAELSDQPDAEHVLRYTVRPLTPAELEARDPVPESVTALQGMLAIQAVGMVAGFNAWKASLDPVDDFAVIAFFEKAQTWRRDNPYLVQGATALGLSDEQLDQLFQLAATL